MLGYWYLFFGFIGIAVVSLILLVVSSKLRNYFYDKYKEYRDKWHYAFGEKEREYEGKKEKYSRKQDVSDGVFNACGGTAIVAGIASLILLLASIFTPVGAKKEVATFEYQKEFVETAIEGGNELENIAITQTIIEQNQWLSKAKASLNTYGCFSKYWGQGIENLEPIKIERGQVQQEAD